MAEVNDLIQITDIQTFLGQTVLNVYFYKVGVLTGVLDVLETLNEFATAVAGPIATVQSEDLIHIQRDWLNISTGLEIGTDPNEIPGTALGPVSPSFLSFNITLLRTTALTRSGRKSIAGVREIDTDGNDVALTGGQISTLENAASANVVAKDDLDVSIGFLAAVIPRRNPLTGLPDPLNLNPISGGKLRGLGTQNTRKPRTTI